MNENQHSIVLAMIIAITVITCCVVIRDGIIRYEEIRAERGWFEGYDPSPGVVNFNVDQDGVVTEGEEE